MEQSNTPAPAPKDFNALVDDLKNNPALYSKIGPSMALLVPGNFNGLIDLLAAHGYSITADEVIQFIKSHPNLADVIARHPSWMNWLNADTNFTAPKP